MNHNRYALEFVLVAFFISILLFLSPTTIGAQENEPQVPTSPDSAVGTAFTYQGRLTDEGVPANGSYDFRFYLWSDEVKNTLLGTYPESSTITIDVADGNFTTTLDFGVGVFDGDERWLEIEVNGSLLAPLQPITPAPYAIYAQTAPWSGLSGVPVGFADGTDDGLESVTWLDILNRPSGLDDGDQDTTYSPGYGLGLENTIFNVMTDTIQTRVSEACAAGFAIRQVNPDGSVVCEQDDGSAYYPGYGLSLEGTTFSVMTDTIQTRVSGSCEVGSTIRVINEDGSVECESDDVDDIVSWSEISAIVGTGSSQVAQGSHTHDDRYYTETEIQTSGSAQVHWNNLTSVPSDLADGDDDTLASQSCANGEVLKHSDTTWVCSPFNADTVDGYEGAALEESAEIDTDIAAHMAIVDAHHPRYTNEEAWTAVLDSDGTGSGLDADLLDGQQASSFASTTHEHNGADITSGTVAEPRIDAALTRDSEVMSHVLAGDGPGSGLNADLLDGYHSSAFAGASHTHWGASWSGTGTGLYLSSSNDIGLNSSGDWYGVWGETEAGTAGTLGYVTSTTGGGRGVWGYTHSSAGTGVRGDAAASSGTTYGVYGRSNSPGGYGVFGSTDDNYGVYGEAFATTGTNFGTYGRSHSTSGRGIWGWASASTGSGIGVGGGTAAGGYGLYTGNNLYVGGSCVGCTSVFIATNASQETLLVGEVVVANGVGPVLQGHSVPVLQVRHATSDDVSVLGVVYRRGEFYPASDEQPEVGDIVQPGEGDIAPGDYLMVITSGLGQVRVDPGLRTLTPGQNLTVAGTAGRATAARADTAPKLVFARVVETEPDTNGLLWALIAPQ
jgi:hypothetical protein